MFLSNSNTKFNDSSQINSSTISSAPSSNGLKFPTLILESLLQNNDILETLFKPIANNNDGDMVLDAAKFDEKISFFENKKDEAEDSSKIYGNAFLGPSLWNKNELFPSDKFNVKLEYLDVQEFLAENDLNGNEVEFLDELQNLETKPTTSTIATSNNNNNNNNNNQNNYIPFQLSLPQTTTTTTTTSPPISPMKTSPINTNDVNTDVLNFDLNSFDVGSPKFNFDNLNDDLKDLIQSCKSQISQDTDNFDDNDTWNAKNTEFLDDLDDDSMLSDDQLYANMSQLTGDEASASRKSRKQFIPNELKDEKYWIRRRKNNLAAKRSRDARRMKENQVALRAAFLERENASLKRQLDECKRETKNLKTRLARYEQRKD